MSKFYKKQVLLTCLLLMFSVMALAQVKVAGVVKDAEGQAMPGVTVALKGTTNAVSTNSDGKYTINAPKDGILTFSFTGFTAKEIKINSKTNLDVVLTSTTKALDEVVVVGYGTQKKVNLSGSVNTVDTKELVNRPVTSLTNALQGLVPGVAVVQTPGDVGSDVGSLNVRGPGNLGSSDPLYVVDGVPVTSDYFARINTNDVASISILKDASASSIYGSRAAYGVILVTTKKGKDGKAVINYNGYYGLQSATVLPSWLGSYDYATLLNEAYANAGRGPVYSADALTKIKNQSDPNEYPNNNWYSLTLKKNAPISEHEINISGGGKTSYFLSGAYFDQSSLLPSESLQRYSFRSNVESQVSDKFKVGADVSYIRDGLDNSDGSISFVTLNREVPLQVAKQTNGDWGSVIGGAVSANAAGNTLRTLADGGRNGYVTNRFLGAVNGDYTPIKGLDINGMASYNTYNDVSSTFTSTIDPLTNFYTGDPVPGTAVTPNQLSEYWETNNKLLTQFTSSYEKTLGKHYFKLLGGASYERYMDRYIQVVRKDFVNNDLDAINAGSTDPANTTASGDIYESTVLSYFGRFNYSYHDRYLLEASIRSDASSQFAPGHRWGTYPSFSGAWRISQEDFMKDIHWISELKLRGSWGKLGNINNVGYYDFYDGLGTGTTAILDESMQDGVYPGKLANPTLSWEKVTMTNIGLDAGLFDNKLSMQLDAFNRMTNGILLTDPSVPQEAGLGGGYSPSVNLGKVQNKGIEVSLDYKTHIGGDFRFSVGGNFSRIWNKIVDLGGQDNLTYGSYFIDKVGSPIGSFYMYQADGLFVSNAEVAKSATQSTNTAAGDIKYVDQNHDGVIDGDDRVITGNNVPYITYGLHFTANYKNFDFAVLGQGVTGVKVYLEDEASQAFFNGAGVKQYVLDRWTPANPNPNAPYPRLLISGDNTQNLVQSSFWLFNADYFRVKSLTLGYTLPKAILDRVHIHGLRVYMSSNNPFTIRADKRLKDFDPESPSYRATYPQLKTYSFGVNLSL